MIDAHWKLDSWVCVMLEFQARVLVVLTKYIRYH